MLRSILILLLMFARSFLDLFSLVILNCLGGGLLNLIPSLNAFGVNSFVGWNLTALGYFAIVMVFLKIGSFYRVDDYAIQNLVAVPFSGNIAEMLRKSVFWMYLIFGILGNGSIAVSLMNGLKYFFPYFIASYETIAFFLLFFCFYLLNRFGIDFSKNFNLFLSTLKILIMAIFPLIALFVLPCAIPFNRVFDLFMIRQSIFFTTWLFVGVESILMEQKIDTRSFVPGMISGLIACLFIYILNNYIMITNIPNFGSCSSPYFELFKLVFPGSQLASIFANTSIVLIAFGSLYGWIYICTTTCLSAESYLPESFMRKNAYGIPELMLAFCCFSTPTMMVVIKKLFPTRNLFELVVDFSIILLLLVFVLGIVAFIMTKRASWKEHLKLYRQQIRLDLIKELQEKEDLLEIERALPQEKTLINNCPFMSWVIANLWDLIIFIIATIFVLVAFIGSPFLSSIF